MIKPDATLPTRIPQSLLQRIISDEFPAGTILPSERELQEEYQVSRAVVREAMKLLASRKLLSISHGQGAVVTSDFTEPVMDALLLAFHQADIRAEDIFHVRSLLEPQSAELAAQHATLPQIRRLTDLAASFDDISFHGSEEMIRESLKRWGNLDREFHQLLAESSQNAVLGILIYGHCGHCLELNQHENAYPIPAAFFGVGSPASGHCRRRRPARPASGPAGDGRAY